MKSYKITLAACKTLFDKCNVFLPKDKKVNYSRSSGVNRGDDWGAEKVNNDQMSSHDVQGRKNTSYMRPDPHQIKHVNSGHFWSPEYQPHWNERKHLAADANMHYRLFPMNMWNHQRQAVNGDKTDVADKFVNVNCPFGARVLTQDGTFFTCEHYIVI